MSKRFVVGGVILMLSVTSASALNFSGPPTAELESVQWSLGYSYSYFDMDLDETPIDWADYDNGTLDAGGTDKLKIKDLKTQRHYFVFGYGVTDSWEIFGQLGLADVKTEAKWSEDSSLELNHLNFDNDFAWGVGTRVTLAEQENVKWGVSAQMNWLDTSVDYSYSEPGYSSNTRFDFESYDLLVTLGPTVDMGSFKLYGGPSFYMLRGDFSEKGYDSDNFTWCASSDIEEESNFGGLIGGQCMLSKSYVLSLDISATGDGWGAGAGVQYKF